MAQWLGTTQWEVQREGGEEGRPSAWDYRVLACIQHTRVHDDECAKRFRASMVYSNGGSGGLPGFTMIGSFAEE